MSTASFAPPSRTSSSAASAVGAFAGRVFVVFGPPGSGKGTQCKLLAKHFGFVHISTGDVFRDLCERGTSLGLQAKEFMENGCFVPDEFVLAYMRDRLSQPDVQERGCLLDGFPRTGEQAQELCRIAKVEGVFALHMPNKMLIKRAEKRRIDPVTGEIYHLDFVPPPADIVDRLVRRDRDDECSFRQRITVFNGQSRRVLPYFSGRTYRVEASLEPKEVFDGIARILSAMQKQQPPSSGGPGAAPPAEGVCTICYDAKATHLVTPCGHQCGCEDCLSIVQRTSGRCPICRGHVASVQQVFLCAADGPAPDATTQREAAPTHVDINDTLEGGSMLPTAQAGAPPKDEDDWSDDGGDTTSTEEPVSVSILPCDSVSAESGGEVDVAVIVEVADRTQRPPADICCCVDVSGSMCSRATYEDEEGNRKDDGLSVLDIVKHAVKTVVKTLQDGDRLALVSFNERAATVLELTHMTEEGKDKALEAVDGLRHGGTTNIWAGVHASMEALRTAAVPAGGAGDRLKATLLLTDGQPTVSPPNGHLAELQDYKDGHPDFEFQLNTFGFGYSLDSNLLLDLATGGQGTYAFIPDAVIVGTTFVNSVANILSTLAQGSTLSLTAKGGAEIIGSSTGGLPELEESWGRSVSLGPLQFGQPRDLVVKVRVPPGSRPYLSATVSYVASTGGAQGRAVSEGASREESVAARVARLRADTVKSGFAAIDEAMQNKGREAGARVAALRARVEGADEAAAADGRLVALKADVSGRMTKALLGKERFKRWGKHYLRALMRSHQLQVCTNFMDPGLQPYGGALFRELREVGDGVFLSLPPPQPSNQGAARAVATPHGCHAPVAPVMNTYYAGAGGGCFAPASTVTRVDAGGVCVQVPVGEVQAGDQVRVVDGTARIRCVVRIAREASRGLVALPGGLLVTPGHPVRVDGAWLHARDAPQATRADDCTGVVYNFVLDRCHILPVNGVECATWGHALQGAVIEHAFFGTQRVLEALSSLPGWSSGLVAVSALVKDASTGQVVGLRSDGWAARPPLEPLAACSGRAVAAAAASPRHHGEEKVEGAAVLAF